MRISAQILVASIVCATPLVAQPTIAFVDITVIPMDRERTMEYQTVVVRDGRIAAVGPSASTRAPAGATVIDGRGKFLIPGLGDAHAHLSTPGGGEALAERAMQLYALNGVTMARSMYTEPHHVRVRDRVDRGELLGPRLVLVSPPVGGNNAQTPDAARAAVQTHHASGYRIVKVMPGLTRTTFDTLVAAAHAAGIQLTGHIPADVGLSGVLDARFISVEHLDGFLEALNPPPVNAQQAGFFGLGVVASVDESRIPQLVADVKASGTTVVPTEFEMELFTSTDAGVELAKRPEMRYAPPQLVAGWTQQKEGSARAFGVTAERSARYRELRRRLIRELNAAGVPIAAGSDAFNMFDVAGFGTLSELETLVQSGLTPYQAMAAGTVNVARLMGLDRDVGTIAVGKFADFVLLDANPLGDIANVRRQAGVMLRGRWLAPAEIEAKLAALAAP
jgi:imidazolonepropionase-like amidohydrolase